MLQGRPITKERFNLIEEIIFCLRKIPRYNLSLTQDIYVEFYSEFNNYHIGRIEEIQLIDNLKLSFLVFYWDGLVKVQVYLTDEQLISILEELELFYSNLLSKDI
jgi:hypothetical protein